MELFLHFGIYKTGSSYLQYVCVNQRERLKLSHIWFPVSRFDPAMLNGLISPGNADGLEAGLLEGNASRVRELFQLWFNEAQHNGCNKVLISAEALVHRLAEFSQLHLLEEAAKEAGFQNIHAMGFFRDLVDHAVSTYKHRAKSGRIPNFQEWVAKIYETPVVIHNLFLNISKSYINWSFRKFKKDSNFMLSAFFEDWLKVKLPTFSGKPHVNESMTLSEILLMNQIAKYKGMTVDYYVDALKALPMDKKASNDTLEAYFKYIAWEQLNKYETLLHEVNPYFPESEQLRITPTSLQTISKFPLVVSLSETQLSIFFKTEAEMNSFKGKILVMRRRIARLFPVRLREKLMFYKNIISKK